VTLHAAGSDPTTPVTNEIRADGGSWTSGTVSLASEGSHLVEYRTTDSAGHVASGSITVTLDRTPTGIRVTSDLLRLQVAWDGANWAGMSVYNVQQATSCSADFASYTWVAVLSETTQTQTDLATDPGGCNAVRVQGKPSGGVWGVWVSTGWIAVAETTKYYSFGRQTVAVRQGDAHHPSPAQELAYLSGDQVNSTSLVTDMGGNKVAQLRYEPFSQVRWTSGTLPTDRTYTGQREEGMGLLNYNARMYDPALGRFISPDSLIPEPGDPLAYDRYAYSNNNPINYSDPTGHMTTNGCNYEGCSAGQGEEYRDYIYSVVYAHEDRQANAKIAQTVLVGGAGVMGGMVLGVAGAPLVIEAIGSLAPVVYTAGSAGAALATANIACGGDGCSSELNDAKNIVTVIGRYPANKNLAETIGGNFLNTSMNIWNSMTPDERWARNLQWLQEADIRGDIFRLASPISQAPGSGYGRELVYLYRLGYNVTTNGDYLYKLVNQGN
jgi:RHS repeat-associated protein